MAAGATLNPHEPKPVTINADDEQALDPRCINTLRALAIDQVQQANSGHPGTPMGAAAQLYGLLHLCGFNADTSAAAKGGGLVVSKADLQTFRQAGSRCTGHPEHGWTTGVETTTGPASRCLSTTCSRWPATAT